MLDKAELGRRVKVERLAREMTLKQVADAASLSPTHISEIERGRTSPTVGALMKIAHALGKSATYFVEEEELPTVSVVRLPDRPTRTVTDHGRDIASASYLTAGIPAGRLRVVELANIGPGRVDGPTHEGEEILLVTAGRIRVVIGEKEYGLSEGDCIQFKGTLKHSVERVGEEPAQVLWVTASEGLLAP
jgi:transcriptional regulator with XRE-family HTH domain